MPKSREERSIEECKLYFLRMTYHLFKDGPHPGPMPRRMARRLAGLGDRVREHQRVRARQEAIHAAFIAGGGTEDEWTRLGVLTEQEVSTRTGCEYTRAMVVEALEAKVIG